MNDITGGLLNEFDDLQAQIADMQFKVEEGKVQMPIVERNITVQSSDIEKLSSMERALAQQLMEPVEPLPPESDIEDEEPVDQEQLAAKKLVRLVAILKEFWARKLQATLAERDAISPTLSVWEQKIGEIDFAAIRATETQALSMETHIRSVKKITAEMNARRTQLLKEVRQSQKELNEQTELAMSFQQQLFELPEPDPRRSEVADLKRRVRKLHKEIAAVAEVQEKVQGKISGLRLVLREIYAKLKEEWDQSESEGGEDDEPYWKRKQKMTNAGVGFDSFGFIFAERTFQERRRKKRAEKLKTQSCGAFIYQMEARSGGLGPGEHSRRQLADEEPFAFAPVILLGPFVADTEGMPSDSEGDSIERTLAGTRRRIKIPAAPSPRMRVTRNAAGFELQRALQEHVRACAALLADLLPLDGLLGSLRTRVLDLAERCPEVPEVSMRLEDGDLERQLEDSSVALHGLIGEAMNLSVEGGTAQSSALRSSLDHGELRNRLKEVRAGQRKLQAELHASGSPKRVTLPLLRAGTGGRDDFEVESQSWLEGRDEAPLLAEGKAKPGQRTKWKHDPSIAEEIIDFSFKTDGITEESLESWPSFQANSSQGASRHRRHRPDPEEFKAYMAQCRQAPEAIWQRAAEKEKKAGPSLPQLLRSTSLAGVQKDTEGSRKIKSSATWLSGSASAKFLR